MSNALYREEFIEEARNPRHFGKLKGADFVLEASNPTCGDEITVYLKVDREKGRVEEATFDGRGCMVTMASSSRFLDAIQGKSLAQVKKLSEDDTLKIFNAPLTPGRVDCALMPWQAIRQIQKPNSG